MKMLSAEKQDGKQQKKGIEQKISRKVAVLVICFNLILGICGIACSYIASISSMQNVMNESSDIAGDLISSSMREYTAIAYETGSIARLADPERAVSDKEDIINQRVEDHGFKEGHLTDENGIDLFSGDDLSEKEYFKAAMNGETYVSTPFYSDISKEITVAVSAPLWEGGIPGTKPVGAVCYIPDGEFLNDIIRGIRIGTGGTAFMVDRTGTTIADIDSGLVGTENLIEEGKTDRSLAKLGKIVEHMANGENGVGSYTYKGKTKMVSYSPVSDSDGWSIGVCVVRNEFLTLFYISLAVTLVLMAVFTVIGVRIGADIGRKISKPIHLGVRRLALLADGDLASETPEVHTGDETETLMNALRTTIVKLREMVSDISDNLAELSKGDLTIDVSKDYSGDFSKIGESFREIVASLNNTMQEIDGNAEQVSKGSDDMAGASQSLAGGASDQASSIEELTATVEDISGKIQLNAQKANDVKQIVEEMNANIEESNAHMSEMTGAMDKIMQSSNEIGNIMKTIEEIASQTNLLSLNASIEAARAGEAGRGFAVVADEVGTLAEQTASSTKDTAQLIQNAIKAVEEGTALTRITAESLEQVVKKAGDVQKAVEQIAEASEEQAEAAEQISAGVSQIATVVESNSATAEESAASSEELSAQATQLKELIQRFKFR